MACRFEQAQIDLLFRLGRVPGVPGVLAQAGIRNAGQTPVNLVSLTRQTMAACSSFSARGSSLTV
jgi:hypothetical protein